MWRGGGSSTSQSATSWLTSSGRKLQIFSEGSGRSPGRKVGPIKTKPPGICTGYSVLQEEKCFFFEGQPPLGGYRAPPWGGGCEEKFPVPWEMTTGCLETPSPGGVPPPWGVGLCVGTLPLWFSTNCHPSPRGRESSAFSRLTPCGS